MENSHGSIGAERGVLAQSVPHDIVTVSQRQRIFEAMADCCAEKTYVATTIADIVARAGISRRTFYKLFDNKRDCFDAAVNAFAEEIATMAAAAQPDAGMTWPDAVREAIAQILELLASKPAFTNLVLVEAVVVDPRLLNRYWDPVLEALKQSPIFGEGTQTPTGAARAAFGAAQVLIAQEVTAGRSERLPELLPELVYIALAPFVGQEEALAQVRLAR